jgi:hypothetical protein
MKYENNYGIFWELKGYVLRNGGYIEGIFG